MTKALYELRKFLPALFMPLGLSLVLIGIGLLRRRRAPTLAGLLLLFLSSLPAVSDSLCFVLENQYPHLQIAQCPTADAIVALSGYADEIKRFPGEIQWRESVGRFEAAVNLFRRQKAPLLLFTDGRSPSEDHDPTVELTRQVAIDDGIPGNAIRITRPVATTADEAEAVRDYLAQNGGRHVILVTSAAHMTRAALLFRRAGIAFIPFPVDYHSYGWEWRFDRLVPSADALFRTEQSFHEIYGNLFYSVLPFAGPHASAPR